MDNVNSVRFRKVRHHGKASASEAVKSESDDEVVRSSSRSQRQPAAASGSTDDHSDAAELPVPSVC